eukprot:CAMPEP_0170569526 /NCGR_PEP_ID=MMETSP0224-20130122/598_1 /TAXON_ID=285029 /ORGANISM="Togula jolla, Strain CCCM 725" /LENGTH=73 /DNA_ID=CAMNT_0010891691 /DNA_START=292 /DNA_END=513 /DNA_ORIENTATION=-
MLHILRELCIVAPCDDELCPSPHLSRESSQGTDSQTYILLPLKTIDGEQHLLPIQKADPLSRRGGPSVLALEV